MRFNVNPFPTVVDESREGLQRGRLRDHLHRRQGVAGAAEVRPPEAEGLWIRGERPGRRDPGGGQRGRRLSPARRPPLRQRVCKGGGRRQDVAHRQRLQHFRHQRPLADRGLQEVRPGLGGLQGDDEGVSDPGTNQAKWKCEPWFRR